MRKTALGPFEKVTYIGSTSMVPSPFAKITVVHFADFSNVIPADSRCCNAAFAVSRVIENKSETIFDFYSVISRVAPSSTSTSFPK